MRVKQDVLGRLLDQEPALPAPVRERALVYWRALGRRPASSVAVIDEDKDHNQALIAALQALEDGATDG